MYEEVNEDNGQLELDIEKFKEKVRSLSVQNDDLISELEKISEQDENCRFILNRRGKIESLIAKAESQVQRSHIEYTETKSIRASKVPQ